MNKHLFAFSACLVALTFVATGCLEVKQDFEVHGDGSGIVEIEFKVGKEMSGMVGAQLEGKSQEELDKIAAAQLGEDFRGVYWEKLTQKMVDGQVVLSGRGVFADINTVKMVSKDAGMGMGDEEGEGQPVEKEQLSFKFEQGEAGGKLTFVMDSGQQGMGGPGGAEGEGEGETDPEFAKEMKKMMEEALKPMLEQMKDFKFRISAKVPGEVSKSTVKDLGEGRHGIQVDVKTIEEQSMAGKAGMDGSIEWTGKQAAPEGFAERVAKAKAAWEAGAKEREETRKKLEAESAEEGDMDLEELEKKLKEAEKEQKKAEGGK